MTCPLNVVDLMNGAVNASPEANAQAVASLAMQVNCRFIIFTLFYF